MRTVESRHYRHAAHSASCVCPHLLQAGYDIRSVQGLLGNTNVATTTRYTHVCKVVRPRAEQVSDR
ncbi:tyrosine-type recombinase/integrase [Roseateles sp. LKC17W]|uniref:Tyrosine-type recombinase/integrase n=1 Tax=Pelomonas margarita TaxID=3299031 RepID=A0ABW7FHH9_9BURK